MKPTEESFLRYYKKRVALYALYSKKDKDFKPLIDWKSGTPHYIIMPRFKKKLEETLVKLKEEIIEYGRGTNGNY